MTGYPKLGRNSACPCGSGLKYKKCHADAKHLSRKLNLQHVYEQADAAFRPGKCLAGPPDCSMPAIKSHTIPRSGSLKKIASDGHVYGFQYQRGGVGFEVKRTGVKLASTFGGFCSKHDGPLFSPIESENITPTLEQAFLLAYRPLMRELFMKRGLVASIASIREAARIANPNPYLAAVAIRYLSQVHQGAQRGLADFEASKARYDDVRDSRDYSGVRFYAVATSEVPTVLTSCSVQPEVDFAGAKVTAPGVLSDPSGPSDFLSFHILANDTGGLIVFAWLDSSPACRTVVETFAQLSDEELCDAAVRYAFEFSENTYWNIDWWSQLPANARQALQHRFEETAVPHVTRSPSALASDGVHVAEWGTLTRLSGI